MGRCGFGRQKTTYMRDKSYNRPMTASSHSQPLPILETLGNGMRMARQNAGKSIGLCIVFALIMGALLAVPLFVLIGSSLSVGDDGGISGGMTGGLIAMMILSYIVFFLVAVWGQLSLLGVALVSEIRQGGIADAMRSGWKAIPGFLVGTLALWGILFGAGAAGLIIALMLDSTAMSVLLYLAWLALAIALLPTSMLVAPVSIDGGGVGSFNRARQLARGNSWRLLGLLVALSIASWLLMFGVFLASMVLILILGAISDSLAVLGFVVYFVAILVGYVSIALVSISTPAAAYMALSGAGQPPATYSPVQPTVQESWDTPPWPPTDQPI